LPCAEDDGVRNVIFLHFAGADLDHIDGILRAGDDPGPYRLSSRCSNGRIEHQFPIDPPDGTWPVGAVKGDVADGKAALAAMPARISGIIFPIKLRT